MRLFKATYRDRQGRRRTARRWTVEFRDNHGRPRRLTICPDRAAAEAFGRKIERLTQVVGAGDPPDRDLAAWLAATPPRLRQKLAGLGLLDARAEARSRPLAEHLGDYRRHLEAVGDTPDHVALTLSRIGAVLGNVPAARIGWPRDGGRKVRDSAVERALIKAQENIGARMWADLSAANVEHYLADRRAAGKRPLSRATSNHYLRAVKAFTAWMVREGRAAESPVAYLQGLNEAPDLRRERRALLPEEAVRLLDEAAGGPVRFGLTGPDRAMLYRLAAETGLRRGELASLTPASFDLDARPPTVTVEAAYSKHRRRDVQPLRRDLAETLRAALADRPVRTRLYNVPRKTAEMLRGDLRRARARWIREVADPAARRERRRSYFLAVHDHKGAVVDFHALRHTFCTWLARLGVHPKTAQILARHSTITLTMDHYTHSVVGDVAAALEILPDMTAAPDRTEAPAARLTGTDGNTSIIPLGALLGAAPVRRGALAASAGRTARTGGPESARKEIGPHAGVRAELAPVGPKGEGLARQDMWRGRRGSNPQPPDRQSGTLTS